MSDTKHLMEAGRLAEVGLQLSVLVHELRQPMFAIKGVAQILLEQADDKDRPQLEVLLAQVAQAEHLLERYSSGTQRPTGTPQVVDLADVVAMGVESVLGVHHHVEIATDLESWAVTVDPVAVQQIVSNLVRNAADAARSRVTIRQRAGNIRIEDDGPGVPTDLVPRLYEPFVTTKPPGEGTGLGLFVTSTLVKAIGASISFDTTSAGTVVTVDVPKP